MTEPDTGWWNCKSVYDFANREAERAANPQCRRENNVWQQHKFKFGNPKCLQCGMPEKPVDLTPVNRKNL